MTTRKMRRPPSRSFIEQSLPSGEAELTTDPLPPAACPHRVALRGHAGPGNWEPPWLCEACGSEVPAPGKAPRPSVHLNGTPREALLAQQREVCMAAQALLAALAASRPHGRDYYVQGDRALAAATEAHTERERAVQKVYDDALATYRYLKGETG